MTSTYTISVNASTRLDATDMARRRAAEDGFAVVSVVRTVPIVEFKRYSVELEVKGK